MKGPAALPPPRDPSKTKKVGLLGDAPEPYRPPPKVTKPSRSDVQAVSNYFEILKLSDIRCEYQLFKKAPNNL